MKNIIYLKFLLICCIIGFYITQKTYAQRMPIYDKYYNHPMIINPATAGNEKYAILNCSADKQWLGIPQSPSTQIFSAVARIGMFNFYNPKKYINNSNLKQLGRMGVGIMVFNDKNGPLRNTGIHGAYSYNIPMHRSTLTFGISASIMNSSLRQSEFEPSEANDPVIGNENENLWIPDAHFGCYYNAENYFGGISVTELFETEKYRKYYPTDKENTRDYFLSGGYTFEISRNFAFEPSLIVKYIDNQMLTNDCNAKVYLREYNWVALSLINYETLKYHMAFKLHKYHIGMGYSSTLSKIAGNNAGSLDIMLGYNLGLRNLKYYR